MHTNDLLKEMKTKAPVKNKVEAAHAKAKELGFDVGVEVLIHEMDKGIITSFNEQRHGFYDGHRYPLIIERSRDKQTFEYMLDEVKLLSTSSN